MVLPLILLGFAMLTLGFALLCFGEVSFVRGTRIPALRSRIIGGILVSFLPALWVLRLLIGMIVGANSAGGPIVAWALFFLYMLLIFALVFRILVPKPEKRPIEEILSPEPASEITAKDDNPFHFS